jgi:hypothetical protein
MTSPIATPLASGLKRKCAPAVIIVNDTRYITRGLMRVRAFAQHAVSEIDALSDFAR